MSDTYNVLITREAQNQIRNLDRVMLPRAIACLKALEFEPHPIGVEKLDENPNFWRIMLGTYKIIYTIFAQQRSIVVALVGKRRDVHLEISSLNQHDFATLVASDNVIPLTMGTRH